ncbi:MAG: hypothetical protein NVS4B6_24940 [Mycobacterium sp.]
MATTAIPTLSQIHSWDTQHLESAADHWQARAQNWEDAFRAVYNQVPAPGGVPWDGPAADAALQHVASDRAQAVGAADTLYRAAAVAREGAFQIDGAKQTALQAVRAARNQGFIVGEDLSVTDRLQQPSILAAQREAQAQAHSAAIRSAAMDLATTDATAGSQVTGAAAGLNVTQFSDAVPSSPDDQIVGDRKPGNPHIQMVDDKTPAPTPTPGAQPQIGPFPVPPGIGSNVPPPAAPAPRDPTGGLLTPENLPAPTPPPNIPGVKPAPLPGQPPMMGPPPSPALPSYPDLVKQVQQQGQQLTDQANAAARPTPGGLGAAVLGGCTSTGLTAGILGAETGPIDVPIAAGGCVLGGIGGLGSYLAGLWANNAFSGAG